MSPLVSGDRVLFGRESDLAYLVERSRRKGLTAVLGRPMAGKTWLLRELRKQLEDQRYLVGYAESTGEEADLLLRSANDLYSRWLADATYREQARFLWKKKKGELLSGTGKEVGNLLVEVAAVEPTIAAVTPIVKKVFGGLAGLQHDLTSRAQHRRLSYDQARGLVHALWKLTDGRPSVLMLDALERSPAMRLEVTIMKSYLRRLDEWPDCHVFLGSRDEGEVKEFMAALCRESPAADHYSLGRMDLGGSEESRLLSYIREKVPVARDLGDSALLEKIDGHPGVLHWWLDPSKCDELITAEALAQAAQDAHALRYSDLFEALESLEQMPRALAARLALLRELGSEEDWQVFQPFLSEGKKDQILELESRGILDQRRPYPSFGHTTRYDAARSWFLNRVRQRPYTRREAESLILGLAARITDVNPETRPFSEALVALTDVVESMNLTGLKAVCDAAANTFDDTRKLLSIEEIRGVVRNHSETAALICIGLFRNLVVADEEEDLERRDALLDELRQLQLTRDHPEAPAIREALTRGLIITLLAVKDEKEDLGRREALLDEVRQLAHDQNPVIRLFLADGLVETLHYAKNSKSRDALLDELRQLAYDHPEESAAQESLAAGFVDALAAGLVDTLYYAKEQQDLPRRDALLDELRQLARDRPDGSAVQESLAAGLVDTLNAAKEEQILARRDALLDELRQLARDHPEESAIRESLAEGLFNTLDAAKEEQDLARRDALLDELRQLAYDHLEEAAVQESLAKGLFNTLYYAKEEDQDLPRRDALLEELRHLAQSRLSVREFFNAAGVDLELMSVPPATSPA